MEKDKTGIMRHVVIVCGIALLLYTGAFWLIEDTRQKKGGWEVQFRTDAKGMPEVQVDQPVLGVDQVLVVFPDVRLDRTNFSQRIIFDRPTTNAPFGEVLFLDTTFLPGTVTLGLFGHEVELLPRVLGINRREVAWEAGKRIELYETNRVAGPGKEKEAPGEREARRELKR